jgi:hypothetical protein
MKKAVAIETKYLGPTNTLGARISVSRFEKRKLYDWNDELVPNENHIQAMQAFLKEVRQDLEEECISYSDTDRGFIFHIVPKAVVK